MKRLSAIICLCLAIWLPLSSLTAMASDEPSVIPPSVTSPSETTAKETTQTPEKPKVVEADITHADQVLLYCVETDTILRKKNTDQTISPSTAVKLMTALVAYERISDLTAEITVTKEMVKGVSGSYYGFKEGDTVSGEDLIKLLLLRKSNDAAQILAVSATGDLDSFVTAMNDKARSLGMEHTHFTNCTGLEDPDMTTTAGDLLMLALEFYANDQLLAWSGAGDIRCDSLNRTIYNNNYFLSRYYNGTGTNYLYSAVTGMINGGTKEKGDLLITSAAFNGMHYIVVLAGGKTVDDLPVCYSITRELIEKDTLNFAFTKVLLNAEVISELPVQLGSGADYAAVFPAQTLEYYLPKNTDPKKFNRVIEMTCDSLEAPVQEGDVVGRIKVYYDGVLLGETDLVVRSNITRSGTEYRVAQITEFLSSKMFLIIALSVIGVCALYFVVTAIYREQVSKKYGNEDLY